MAEDYGKTNLIVNYLPQTLSDSEFRNLFQGVGVLKASKIVRHKQTGYSYGFGFIDYETPEDAMRAIQTLNGFQLQNKRIKVAFSRPGGESIKNANLYIRGIPKSMTEDDVEAIFAEYGEIVQCRLLKDGSGSNNKGVGFILYNQRSEAEEAMKALNGTTLEGSSEALSIKYAEDNAKKVKAPPAGGMGLDYGDPFAVDNFGRYGSGGPMRQSAAGRFRFNPMGGSPVSQPGYGYSAPSYGLQFSAGTDGHILFVYNIGPDTDEKTLWQLFARYGTVQKVNVIREGGTGPGKGYGFVTMMSYDEACLAIKSLNGCSFFGKPLQVSFKSGATK